MAKPVAISLAPRQAGEPLIDAQTPLSFLIGFIAGIWGIESSIATITFVAAKIVDQSLQSDPKRALFQRERGESLGNQLSDVIVNFAGVQVGARLRQHLLAPPPAPIEEPTPATEGLGLHHHYPRHQ